MIYKTPKPRICPCGIKFTPRGIQKYHSPSCELAYKTGRVESDKLIDLPYQVLKDLAVGTFQSWIKHRDKDKGCYTCDTKNKVMYHASHYFKKELYSRSIFDEAFCKKCCDHCNVGLNGNLDVFKERLIKEMGVEYFEKEEMFASWYGNYKWDRIELVEIIEKYQAKLKEK